MPKIDRAADKRLARINYPESWPQSARDELDSMFVKARAEGLHFFHNSIHFGPLWFSPDELEAEQKKGSFVFGAVNWTLRPPAERISQRRTLMDAQIETLRAKIHAVVWEWKSSKDRDDAHVLVDLLTEKLATGRDGAPIPA